MVAEGISPEEQERFFELTKYDVTKNSEQLASSLIKDITKNTGFATTKSKLGECFVEDCCTWTKRQADDICGLDGEHLNSETKRKTIVILHFKIHLVRWDFYDYSIQNKDNTQRYGSYYTE